MSSITNIYLHYAMNLDSHYKTIDDYIMEKHKKNKNNKNNNNDDNLLTGVNHHMINIMIKCTILLIKNFQLIQNISKI